MTVVVMADWLGRGAAEQIWKPIWLRSASSCGGLRQEQNLASLSLRHDLEPYHPKRLCIFCEFFCFFVVFCVDGFVAVACGVRVVVGFWVQWLAVGRRFFG